MLLDICHVALAVVHQSENEKREAIAPVLHHCRGAVVAGTLSGQAPRATLAMGLSPIANPAHKTIRGVRSQEAAVRLKKQVACSSTSPLYPSPRRGPEVY